MKRGVGFLFSLILVFGLIFSSPMPVEAAEKGQTYEIKIVHTNDIHARVAESDKDKMIGVARLKTIADEWKKGADLGLVLDSGDLFHGQPIATLVQGESVAELIKSVGYDAMTAGNHDWNYGKDRLKELAEISGLTMLTGNVVNKQGEPFFETPYLIKEAKKDGKVLKIGLFGVIDPDIYSSTAPRNVEGLMFTDPSVYANRMAEELRGTHNCDVVIALTHTYDPAGLAETVSGVDLWLAGHEHKEINEQVREADGTATYIMEDGYYLYNAGLIDMKVTTDEKNRVTGVTCEKTSVDYGLAKEKYAPNQSVTNQLEKIREEQSVILGQKVGSTPVELDGVWEHVRIGETNLGSVVADAYLLETGADVAFENAGGIRASIAAGDVTYDDIIGVSPFGNYIVTKQITGKALKEMMEISLKIKQGSEEANASGDWNGWPENSGSYLQFGGMKVAYDPKGQEGNRVLNIWVGGEKLQENRMYTVATNNFVAISEDYPMLAAAEETGQFCACDEALIRFFAQGEDAVAASASESRLLTKDQTQGQQGDRQPGQMTEDQPDEAISPKTGEESGLWIFMIFVGAAAGILVIGKRRAA